MTTTTQTAKKVSSYNLAEEIANAITHGIGFLLSIPALVFLILIAVSKGGAMHVVSFTIYGVSLMVLYFCSTMLHSLPPSKVRYFFNILDHAAIYLLIAGSYTPYALISLGGALGWSLFGVIWGMSILGIVYKIFFLEKFRILSTVIYIIMGWGIVFAMKPLYEAITGDGIILLIIGGLAFTVGAVIYSFPKIKFGHAIRHLFVLAGTGFIYFSVLLYV